MIDVIDPALAAQNDGGAMAVINELAVAMTTDGGGRTLDAALAEVAAGRGGEAALGQMLKAALAGSASHGALAVLDLLIDRLDPAEAALAAPACGCRGRGGGGSNGGDLEGGIVLMSFTDSSGGGDNGGSGGEGDDGNYIDENGNGQWDEGEPIIVTGTKPKTVDEDGSGYEGDPGSDPGSGGEGGVGGGDMPGEGEEDEPDCRDTKAIQAKTDINNDSNKNHYEHGVIIYRDSSGVVRTSRVMQGGTDHISTDMILQTMQQDGISFSQVIGFVHNHPIDTYGGYLADVNRYPSGGDVPGGDWNNADWFVRNGAGGPGGENFALYIIDTEGKMREFLYSDRDLYKNLDAAERMEGEDLPGQTTGGSCG